MNTKRSMLRNIFFSDSGPLCGNLQLEVKAGKHPKGQIPLSAAVYTRPGIRPRTYPRRFPHSVRLKSGKVFTLKEHALCDKTIYFVKK